MGSSRSLRARERSSSSRRPSAADDAPDADDPAVVPRTSEPDDLDSRARMRRVNHASAAQVQADMSEPGEDEDVARLRVRPCDTSTRSIQGVGAVRKRNAESPVGPVDEAGAVEPALRRGATPSIRNVDCPERDSCCTLAEGGLGPPNARRSPISTRRRSGSLDRDRCPLASGRRIARCPRRRAAEDDRGNGERKQSSAEGVRHSGEGNDGPLKPSRVQPWPVRYVGP
jgi:hypothetical protein